MPGILDITPLRSLVGVADNGGFLRAADALHLSQAGVSQHIRRLEAALGVKLVERDGRSSRFTDEGEALLGYARQILEVHDRALAHFVPEEQSVLVVGSTEHAAVQLLPSLTAALSGRSRPLAAAGADAEDGVPGRGSSAPEVRLRLDRGARLRADLVAGRIDLAVLPGPTAHPELDGAARAASIGALDLTWLSAPGWSAPRPGVVPLVAFESPCALRSRAVETLHENGLAPTVAGEAVQLAGVHAAAASGVGVALMATLGQVPEGLVEATSLPPARPLEFALWGRAGVDRAVFATALGVLRAEVLRAEVQRAAGRGGVERAEVAHH